MISVNTGGAVSMRYGKGVDYSRFKSSVVAEIGSTIAHTRRIAEQFRPKATRELDTCPLCRSKNISPCIVIYDYPYFKCGKCALVFLQKRLPPDALVEYWKTGLRSGTYADAATYTYRLEHVARPKVEFVLEHWNAPPGKWLDLGCGIGDALVVANEKGWTTLGLEVSEPCCEFARSRFGLPVLQTTIQGYQASPSRQQDWDVIFASGYFDLIDALQEELILARDLLKRGGLLFMKNPNWKSLSMSLACKNPQNMHRFVCPPGTTGLFCDVTYEVICRDFGFTKKAFWHFGMDIYELLNQLVSLGHMEAGSKERTALSAHMPEFQLALDKMGMSDYTHVLLQKA